MNRGAAAGIPRTGRGGARRGHSEDGSRRRRGARLDIPRGRVAAGRDADIPRTHRGAAAGDADIPRTREREGLPEDSKVRARSRRRRRGCSAELDTPRAGSAARRRGRDRPRRRGGEPFAPRRIVPGGGSRRRHGGRASGSSPPREPTLDAARAQADGSRYHALVGRAAAPPPRAVAGSLLAADVDALRAELAAADAAKALEEEDGDDDAVDLATRGDGALWVDRYAPTSFHHLLSDERANRDVLRALKDWDPHTGRADPVLLEQRDVVPKRTGLGLAARSAQVRLQAARAGAAEAARVSTAADVDRRRRPRQSRQL